MFVFALLEDNDDREGGGGGAISCFEKLASFFLLTLTC